MMQVTETCYLDVRCDGVDGQKVTLPSQVEGRIVLVWSENGRTCHSHFAKRMIRKRNCRNVVIYGSNVG